MEHIQGGADRAHRIMAGGARAEGGIGYPPLIGFPLPFLLP